MSPRNLTPWYPGTTKPHRVGVYQRSYSKQPPLNARVLFCFWNGRYWSPGDWGAEGASDLADYLGPSLEQALPWRGLTLDAAMSEGVAHGWRVKEVAVKEASLAHACRQLWMHAEKQKYG